MQNWFMLKSFQYPRLLRWTGLIILLFTLYPKQGSGQDEIFPGLEGEILLDSLVGKYKTNTVLNWSNARDTLYGRIDKYNDSIYGIYTQHALHLPTGVDPTQWLFMNGSANGINTEHAYPQSKGAFDGTQGHSDMYNLYPTRTAVNSARADFPYAEIDDNITDTWYRHSQERNAIPIQHIDEYSEWTNSKFEVREDQKGNIARSIFYFFTTYRDFALAADPDYFELQREDLCYWHFEDPADEREEMRNELIATYQGGYKNPFILDCTLAERSYCMDIPTECMPTSVEPTTFLEDLELQVQSAGPTINLKLNCDLCKVQKIDLFHISGIYISNKSINSVINGYQQFELHSGHLPSGMYIVNVRVEYSGQFFSKQLKWININQH